MSALDELIDGLIDDMICSFDVRSENYRQWNEAAAELAALRAELARKTQILKELEYIEYPDDIEVRLDYYMKFKFCPVCGYKEPDGHWKDCELGSACEDLK